jgi:hypothetical protein
VKGERIHPLGRRIPQAQQLLRLFYQRPVQSARDVAQALGGSATSVNKLLADLESLCILLESTGYKRNRMFVFTEYLALFEWWAEIKQPGLFRLKGLASRAFLRVEAPPVRGITLARKTFAMLASRLLFQGHDTFLCHNSWLKKGHDFVQEGGGFNDAEAVVRLG